MGDTNHSQFANMDDGDAPLRNPTRMLCIAQYWRGKRLNCNTKPMHWVLFALWNGNANTWLRARTSDEHDHWGTCYQVTGDQVTYAYSRTTDECMEILRDDFRGCLFLGEVREEDVEAMENVLEKVPIHRHRTDWDCHDWVIASLDALMVKGFVRKDVTPGWVRKEMEDLFRHWGKTPTVTDDPMDIEW